MRGVTSSTAHACAVHVATQRGLAHRLPHHHPPRVQPVAPMRERTADVHGEPRGVAPLRHSLVLRNTPVARTGGATAQSPHHFTGCNARPSILFSPPGNGFSTLAARWKLLI